MPELAEIAALERGRSELDDQRRDAQIAVDDLSTAQAKVDADVEQVKVRRQRDQQRMDAGQVGNPKDLQRMQHEMDSLLRRISSLEDDELEVMEQLEEAQSQLDALTAQVAAADERLAVLSATRDQKLAAIEEQERTVALDRGPMLDGMPADLLALYERLRAAKGGVGAAALRARQCGGCMLGLDNAELGRIRAAATDAVIRCEECQRILVRTPESGL